MITEILKKQNYKEFFTKEFKIDYVPKECLLGKNLCRKTVLGNQEYECPYFISIATNNPKKNSYVLSPRPYCILNEIKNENIYFLLQVMQEHTLIFNNILNNKELINRISIFIKGVLGNE